MTTPRPDPAPGAPRRPDTAPVPDPGLDIVQVPRAWHDAHLPTERPKLRIFWDVFTVSLLVLTVLCGAVTGLVVLGGAVYPGAAPTALALGVGVLFVAVVWALVARSVLYRGTPFRLGLAAVAWGVTGGVVLGGFTSSDHLSELAVGWGAPQIAWSLAGAWPEETAKAFGVVLLLFAGRTWWNRPWHGLVAGVLVGTGFEAFENALYAVSLAPTHAWSDTSGVLQMWLTRLAAGLLLHALCTGLAGYGIGAALLRAGLRPGQRIGRVVGGWGAGFCVHALWNLAPDWENGSDAAAFVRMALVWGGGVAAVAVLWVRSAREARAAAAVGLYPVVTLYRKRPPVPVVPVVPVGPAGPFGPLPGVPGHSQEAVRGPVPGPPQAPRKDMFPGDNLGAHPGDTPGPGAR